MKEILGWIIYGANLTLQLMPDKCKKKEHLIKKVCKLKYCKLEQFQELSGKLHHA